MKRFKLISTSITNSQVPEEFRLEYRKEFLRLVELVPDGATASQMGTAIKVAGKLQNTSEGHDVHLEDAEWEYLLGKLRAAKFNFVAPEIIAMVEAVEKAESCEAPHLKGESDPPKTNERQRAFNAPAAELRPVLSE